MSRRERLLWEIFPPDQNASSFLFGSMHVSDKRAFGAIEFIKSFIDQCELFATEIEVEEGNLNFDEMSPFLPDHQSLTDLIGRKKYEKLEKILQKAFDLPLVSYDQLLPIFIIQQISNAILASDFPLSLDQYLADYALKNGKRTTGLETIQEQFKILKRIPLGAQVKSLLSFGKNPKKSRQNILKMVDLYEKGALNQLYQFNKRQLGKLKRTMLYDRNKVMATRLLPYIKSNRTFTVVGAAHLPGQMGMLRLLKQYGCRVKPIAFA